ncbi:MAG TPA: serine/threonine-protein kinase [Myxococcales bacterium]|jgi:serine/threonine-protein kinase
MTAQPNPSPLRFVRQLSHGSPQLTTPSTLTPEAAELLRKRVSILSRLALGLSALLMVVALLDWGALAPQGTDWSHLLMYGPVLAVPAALWVLLRRPRPPNLIYAGEALMLVCSSVVFGLTCRFTSGFAMPQILKSVAQPLPPVAFQAAAILMQNFMLACMLLGSTQIMVARAALVPSSVRHSLALTAAVGLPVVLINGAGFVPFFEADAELRAVLVPATRWALALMATVWWCLTVMVCGVVTSVMHRLRVEVTKARQLGQYTLEEKLGEGGMGVVYRAHHAMMRRPTAVKLLPPERAGADSVVRFEREVQLTAQLTHPNTITLYDYGRTSEGVFYYAMELLDGANLEQVVDWDGPQPPARVVRILRMMAGALSEAHAAGLIHRDVKPANVFLCTRGGEPDVVKVLDFGLVKTCAPSAAAAGISQVGQITGTPLYMSPEAIATPRSIDARSDLYAVGAVGYYLLTGKHLFEVRAPVEACAHQLHTVPTRPTVRLGAPLPADLEDLVMACLEKDPGKRPQSAEALLARLAECRDVGTWSAAQARQWWATHGSQPKRPMKDLAPSENASTLVSDRPAVAG